MLGVKRLKEPLLMVIESLSRGEEPRGIALFVIIQAAHIDNNIALIQQLRIACSDNNYA